MRKLIFFTLFLLGCGTSSTTIQKDSAVKKNEIVNTDEAERADLIVESSLPDYQYEKSPGTDTVCIGTYKAYCHRPNINSDDVKPGEDFPIQYNNDIIYLYHQPGYNDDIEFASEEKRNAVVDSITVDGTLVKCYNTASIAGEISETYIYISYNGKKYWTLASEIWLQHEDLLDTTVNPPILPYTAAHPEVYFELVK
jgi:hypothetical protein